MFNIQPVIEANLVKNKILDADIYGTNGGLKSILRKISVCVSLEHQGHNSFLI